MAHRRLPSVADTDRLSDRVHRPVVSVPAQGRALARSFQATPARQRLVAQCRAERVDRTDVCGPGRGVRSGMRHRVLAVSFEMGAARAGVHDPAAGRAAIGLCLGLLLAADACQSSGHRAGRCPCTCGHGRALCVHHRHGQSRGLRPQPGAGRQGYGRQHLSNALARHPPEHRSGADVGRDPSLRPFLGRDRRGAFHREPQCLHLATPDLGWHHHRPRSDDGGCRSLVDREQPRAAGDESSHRIEALPLHIDSQRNKK
jgi:hypothetical protein